MRKIYFVLFFLFMASVCIFGQTDKNVVNGKIFIREVSAACKMFKDRGCLITTYHILTFNDNTVTLSYEITNDCDTPYSGTDRETKDDIATYTYQLHKKKDSPNYIIRINGYNGFEVFPYRLVELPPIDNPDYPEENKIVFELKK